MTIVSEDGRFEWDSAKDKENRRKHLLSFEEILDVFDDPAFLEIDDEEHSVFEERFRGIGSIRGIVIITTCFVERGERIRIINARRATAYEEGIAVDDEAPEITPEQASRARLAHESHPEWYRVTPVKQQICIKIDKDVLDALKAEGRGYQTRINKILREAVLGA